MIEFVKNIKCWRGIPTKIKKKSKLLNLVSLHLFQVFVDLGFTEPVGNGLFKSTDFLFLIRTRCDYDELTTKTTRNMPSKFELRFAAWSDRHYTFDIPSKCPDTARSTTHDGHQHSNRSSDKQTNWTNGRIYLFKSCLKLHYTRNQRDGILFWNSDTSQRRPYKVR